MDIETLLAQLGSAKKAEKRAEAADALGNFGKRALGAVPNLLTALDDNDRYVRIRTALALGKVGSPAALINPALFKKVVDGDASATCASYSLVETREGILFLLDTIKDGSSGEAVAAFYCLHHFGYKRMLPHYQECAPAVLSATEALAFGVQEGSKRDAAVLVCGAMLSNPELGNADLVSRVNDALLALMAGDCVELGASASVTLGRMGINADGTIESLCQALQEDRWWAPYAYRSLEAIDKLEGKSGRDIFATNLPISRGDFEGRYQPLRWQTLPSEVAKRYAAAAPPPKMATSSGTVEVLGVHKVRAKEPCYLVELMIHESSGRFSFADFGQVVEAYGKQSHQVAYDEKFLNSAGDQELNHTGLEWPDGGSSLKWQGEVRLAFFLHYVDFDKPLETPFGQVALPDVTDRPARLKLMRYRKP